MVELDERLLTPLGVAVARYVGDTTAYAPDLTTPTGFHIGRTLPGLALSPVVHGGALQLFIAYDQDLSACEATICAYCDHAQIHPATLYMDKRAIVGRGYWVRGHLTDLMQLCVVCKRTGMSALTPVLMTPPAGYVSPVSHGRVVVPFRDGTVGTSILSPNAHSWLRRTLSDGGHRPVLEHLDFNGRHMGTTDTEDNIRTTLDTIRDRFTTSDLHNSGMTKFQSHLLNLESYQVVQL